MPSSGEVKDALEKLAKFSIQREIVQGANAFAFKVMTTSSDRESYQGHLLQPGGRVPSHFENRGIGAGDPRSPKPENLVEVYGAQIIRCGG